MLIWPFFGDIYFFNGLWSAFFHDWTLSFKFDGKIDFFLFFIFLGFFLLIKVLWFLLILS